MNFPRLCAGLFLSVFCVNAIADNIPDMFVPPPSFPVITLYENGASPNCSRKPVCTQTVGLRLFNAAGNIAPIDTVFFVNDTLTIVSSAPLPSPSLDSIYPVIIYPYSYYVTTFDRWGKFTVVLRTAVNASAFSKIASVFIYPSFSTRPLMPLSTSPTLLDVTFGQSHSNCNPTYRNLQTRIKADTITLMYVETPFADPCDKVYLQTPIRYGASFNLGFLDTGNYAIKADTMALGTINVSNGYSLSGSALVMKNPDYKLPSVPVSNVLVTGIVFSPCYGLPNFDTVSATSNSFGAFSLLLPRAGYRYTISAEKEGYYPQCIAVSDTTPKGQVSFELIPKTMDTVGALSMTITDNKVPVESVYVDLFPGREPSMCPIYAQLLKKAAQTWTSGYTDKNGRVSFTAVSLVPFIDFLYTIAYTKSGTTRRTSGYVRLNPLKTTSLSYDIGTTRILLAGKSQTSGRIGIVSGRFLSFEGMDRKFGASASIGIYDIRGRIAMTASVKSSSRINLSSLAAGRYVLRISSPRLTVTEGLLLQ